MTYYNGNAYRDEITAWAHDTCLPEDQIETVVMPDGSMYRHQKQPWNWSPVWGSPEPCSYCGGLVS